MDKDPERRWLTLAAGTIALTAGCTFQYGLAYLMPALLVAADGYSAAFAVAAVLPLAAAALVPVAALEVTARPG